MLHRRSLGAQGFQVSALGLGCMGMSQSYGALDEAESIATIRRAIDIGVTFFDTAEAYGPYTNEQLLGRALKHHWNQVEISTKFGIDIQDGRVLGVNSRPEHIREVADACLQRLGTDHIDLFFQHRVDPNVPMEDVAGTVGDLVRAGKVRFFGVSEAGLSNIRRAHAVHPVSVLQSEYSLWERNLESEIIPALRTLGIGLIAFCPLGRGLLTGRATSAEAYDEDDFRRGDPRFQGENFAANMCATETLRDIAAHKGAKSGQVALAWLLHKGDDIVPIPGTKRRTYLEENVGSASLQLSEQEIAALDVALAPTKISGSRYNEQNMARIDR